MVSSDLMHDSARCHGLHERQVLWQDSCEEEGKHRMCNRLFSGGISARCIFNGFQAMHAAHIHMLQPLHDTDLYSIIRNV